MQNKTRESGRTMIEMLGVLAIIGILTVGSIGLYSVAMKQIKRSQVVQEVQLLVQQIRSIYAGSEDYADLDNGIIVASGLKETNPFGGKYEVGPSRGDETMFEIHVTGLQEADCKYFKIYNWEDSVENQKKGRGGAQSLPPQCNSVQGDNRIFIQYR